MTDITEEEHSERGPSTAHRWIECPGSVLKSRGIPNVAGIEAARGTVFHEVAAMCVQHGLDPFGFVGLKILVPPHGEIEFDREMADNMLPGLDLIESYLTDKTILLVEKRVSLENWVGENEFGTADVTIIDVENWRITGLDWKYGAGVPVQPNRNPQAMLYLLGAWSDHAHDIFQEAVLAGDPSGATEAGAPWAEDVEVNIIIEQPRAPGGGGFWQTNMGYLLAEGERIRAAADLTQEPDAPVIAGEKQCTFCPAARVNACRERADYLLGMAMIHLDSIEAAPEEEIVLPKAIEPAARSRILLHRSQIKQYLDELHEEAYKDYEMGRPVPGMKMIAGRRPPRAWKDEKKAEAILKSRLGNDAYHPPKVISPTEAEKTVGKRTFREQYKRHVFEGEAKPVLVPEDNPGEALKNYLDYLPDPDIENLV